MITKPCECEHVSHFEKKLTPNGNPGHKYGVRYAESYLTPGPMGLTICRDCGSDCAQAIPGMSSAERMVSE